MGSKRVFGDFLLAQKVTRRRQNTIQYTVGYRQKRIPLRQRDKKPPPSPEGKKTNQLSSSEDHKIKNKGVTAMYLYNSATHKKEEFKTHTSGDTRSVYDARTNAIEGLQTNGRDFSVILRIPFGKNAR